MMILWGHSDQVMSGRHTEYISVECRHHSPTLPNTRAVRREITPRGITRTTEALLTHWDRVTHICVSKTTIIGPDSGLLPGRRHYLNQCWNIVSSNPRNKLQWKYIHFHSRKCIWKCCLRNGDNFVSASICLPHRAEFVWEKSQTIINTWNIVNILAAACLATQGAPGSAARILT